MSASASTMPHSWLPTSVKEVRDRGWGELDIILFTGDAYIDHPAFGIPVITSYSIHYTKLYDTGSFYVPVRICDSNGI